MTISKVRAIISIVIVIGFFVVSAGIVLTPVVGGYPPEPYTEHLKTFGSLYSGIVGLIIGFYFGKRA